jgi:hypothetical protein
MGVSLRPEKAKAGPGGVTIVCPKVPAAIMGILKGIRYFETLLPADKIASVSFVTET